MVVKLKDIEVQWYEGLRLEDYGDSPAFDRWGAFQNFLGELYDTDQWWRKEKGMSEGGYTKVKAKIIWKDGTTLVDRIDLGPSEGDFNPNKEYVGDYLRKQNQAMYESDFSTEKPRTNYSWVDEEDREPTAKEERELREMELTTYSTPKRPSNIGDNELYSIDEIKKAVTIVVGDDGFKGEKVARILEITRSVDRVKL